MNNSKLNIAIVCSALPFQIIKEKLNDWSIKKLYVPKNLYDSYCVLNSCNSDLEIIKYSNNLQSFLNLTLNLLKTKFTKNYFYFFHECGFFVFDILIKIINPKSHFFPQVTLQSFTEIKYSEYKSNLLKYLLWIPSIRNKFKYFQGQENNFIKIYLIKCKKYPKNVIKHTVEESILIKRKVSYNSIKKNNKDILFITSKDIISEEYLKNFYENLARKLTINNFKVYQKDHPRNGSRLNLKSRYIIDLNPSIIVESLSNNFKYAIGVCSTGLLSFRKRGISTIYMHNIKFFEIEKRILHIKSLDLKNDLFFPKKMNQLISKVKD